MKSNWKTNRRNLLSLLTGTVAALIKPHEVFAAIPTPSAVEGPFYPPSAMRFADADNDLVKIEGLVREAGGEIMYLNGLLLDTNKKPIKNARVEIWQCDVNGRYLHSGDGQAVNRDDAFQGFGYVITGDDGAYEFRTIIPVAYPGRTPHIHVKVITNETEFITQFYLSDEPANNRDFLYNRLADEARSAVEMVVTDNGRGPEAQIDIII